MPVPDAIHAASPSDPATAAATTTTTTTTDRPLPPQPGMTDAPASRALLPRVALVLVLALAAYLRYRTIGAQPIWFDESASSRIAVDVPWSDLLLAIRKGENTPPLYYVVLKLWVSGFGSGEASLRMPSLIFGVASVFLLYRLGARLVGRWTGVLAALFMAVSSYQVFYSQEARAYELLVLLALWSCDEYLTLLRRPTTATEVRYWLASVLLLHTHLYAGFILIAQNIAYFLGVLVNWRLYFGRTASVEGDATVATQAAQAPPAPLPPARWVMLQVAVAAGFAWYVPTVLDWYRFRAEAFWIPRPDVHGITGAYLAYAGSAALPIAFAIFIVIGGARREIRPHLPLLLGWLLLPVVVPVIVSMIGHPLFVDRYGIIAAPVIYLLAAAGATAVPLRIAIAPALAVAVTVLSLRASPPQGKEDWRGVGAYVTRYAQPGDYVMINQRGAKWAFLRYFPRDDCTVKGFPDSAITLGLPIEHGAHVWLIMANPNVQPIAVIQRGNWRVLSQRAFRDIVLFELDAGVTDRRNALPDEDRFNAKREPPRGPATTRGSPVPTLSPAKDE